MAFRPVRTLGRTLMGHRNAGNIQAVQGVPMATDPGASAIQQQLYQGQQQAARQMAGMGAARGSTALNRFQAQNQGSQMMTDANQQAAIQRAQLEQQAAQMQSQQGFEGQMAQQGYQEDVRNKNNQGLAGLAQGVVGAAGGMLMSDIRAKEDVRPLALPLPDPNFHGGERMALPLPDPNFQGGDRLALPLPDPNYSDPYGPGIASDVRAKEDIRPLGGTPALQEALAGYAPSQDQQSGPTPELAAAMGRYAPEQSVPERAQELDQAVAMGLLSYEQLDADDRTLLNRYTQAKGEQQRSAQGVAGAIREPSQYERGYQDMQGRLTGPMQPYEYRYRPEAAAAFGQDTAPRVGVMAQDAARSPLYSSTVQRMPDGSLGFDRDRLDSANVAGIADIDKRLTAIEQGKEPTIGERIGYGLSRGFGGETGPPPWQTAEFRYGRDGRTPPQTAEYDYARDGDPFAPGKFQPAFRRYGGR